MRDETWEPEARWVVALGGLWISLNDPAVACKREQVAEFFPRESLRAEEEAELGFRDRKVKSQDDPGAGRAHPVKGKAPKAPENLKRRT